MAKFTTLVLGLLFFGSSTLLALPTNSSPAYLGPHLPPGQLRHRPRQLAKEMPYGGIITFGNAPVTVPRQEPCPKCAKPNNRKATPTEEGALEVARESSSEAVLDDSMVEAAQTLDSLRSGSNNSSGFIERVQAIPLVNSAIKVYGRSRESSTLIRVGSNVIESGVRRMYEPIAKRIDVAQLDNFACRQLDNLSNLRKRTKDQADGDDTELVYNNGKDKKNNSNSGIVGNLVASARERALAYREDSLRRLKYCLDWVVYAAALINEHIKGLRQIEPIISMQMVQKARREIISVVRKAVGVVSSYAGSVLPGEARRQVRGLILGLPNRWHMADPVSRGTSSVGSSNGSPYSQADVDVEARRTLAFATESFHMLDSVRRVFHNLYVNAERWMGVETAPQPPDDSTEGNEFTGYRALAHKRPGASTPTLPLSTSDEPFVGGRVAMVELEQMHISQPPDLHSRAHKRNRTREPSPT
ncbi:transcriptional regulator opi1 [Coemansia umbellata]|uniref:Transcriptional regulator opi1 n=1 Tax=Coemansia umbellata TaxID=1424467 RepID=A0ABQ8PHD2_9FUNG|nr:transcriptional regulator opi1 [Coemansia umbellata]